MDIDISKVKVSESNPRIKWAAIFASIPKGKARPLEDLAKEHGITVDAVRKAANQHGAMRFVTVGGIAIQVAVNPKGV